VYSNGGVYGTLSDTEPLLIGELEGRSWRGESHFYRCNGPAGLLEEYPVQCGEIVAVDDSSPSNGPEAPLRVRHANPIHAANGMTFDVHGSGPFALEIFDTTGQLIRRFADPSSGSGARPIAWDLRDRDGQAVVPGAYFYRLAGNGGSSQQRIVIRP
jgi:hypothetical protein